MNKISVNLWYDKEASEAAEFYCQTFPDTRIVSRYEMHDTPSGEVEIINVSLMGFDFVLMSAGPYFKPSPAISFHIPCYSEAEVEDIWHKLTPNGKVLMELGEYPFSKKYGWVEDKYGFSWQIIMVEPGIPKVVTPVLMYTGQNAGRAEEAVALYTSVFDNSEIKAVSRYPAGMEPDIEGSVMYLDFHLLGQKMGAMDSRRDHKFTFGEAISIIVTCRDQEEIDKYFDKLSAVPESEQCGWLKDKYGVSWQIVPEGVEKFFAGKDKEKMAKVMKVFLEMKKIDIATLEKLI